MQSPFDPYDASPEAVAWRKWNKKVMRPYVCKLPRDYWWLKWIAIWLAAVAVAAGSL